MTMKAKATKTKNISKINKKKNYKRKRFTSKEILSVSSLYYSVLALLSQPENSLKNWHIFFSSN